MELLCWGQNMAAATVKCQTTPTHQVCLHRATDYRAIITTMSSFHKFTLANGVRVLVEPVNYVQSAAIGLWCQTGSRHENVDEAGITHLIEHMLFKGTQRRTAKEIAEDIEGRGGALNAFTDKEATCYYCRVLADDVKNGIDVLSDMMRNSLIEPDELEREAGVVLEEISRSEDEPESHVHELHLENRWGDHPLGKPIIGTRESVAGFRRENLTRYMDRRYRGNNVLLSIAGRVDPAEIEAFANEMLGGIAEGGETTPVPAPVPKVAKSEVGKEVEQVHFCIGTDACSIYDENIYVLRLLDSVLGGGMSSRLFQEIREKRGLAYSVGSYAMNYSAGGAFTIYGGTSPKTWDQVQQLVREEIGKLIHTGLEDGELERNKKCLSGHIVLALEGMSARMNRMARNELIFGRDITVEETLQKLNAVTEQQLRDMAADILDESKISITAIGPFDHAA